MQSETVIKWSKYITKQQLQRHLRKEKKTVPCTNVWRALGTKPCTVERTNKSSKRSVISKVSAKRKECQSLRQPALSLWLHSCLGQWAWAIVNHIDHANHVYQANQHCDQCCYSYWRIRRIFVNPRVMDIRIFSSRANIKRFSKSASFGHSEKLQPLQATSTTLYWAEKKPSLGTFGSGLPLHVDDLPSFVLVSMHVAVFCGEVKVHMCLV